MDLSRYLSQGAVGFDLNPYSSHEEVDSILRVKYEFPVKCKVEVGEGCCNPLLKIRFGVESVPVLGQTILQLVEIHAYSTTPVKYILEEVYDTYLVVESDDSHLWYIEGNSKDGDMWARNNIEGHSMGWRVPLSATVQQALDAVLATHKVRKVGA